MRSETHILTIYEQDLAVELVSGKRKKRDRCESEYANENEIIGKSCTILYSVLVYFILWTFSCHKS
jgi:hypothetical protein